MRQLLEEIELPGPPVWSVLGKDASVKTVITDDRVHTYDLYNLTDREALRYGSRFGDNINLVWGDPGTSDNIRFVSASASSQPIKYDEPIAINVRSGNYLVYESGRWGINLGWSDTPKYEWRIRGGQPYWDEYYVATATPVSLYSIVENDNLIYEERDWGINLKWFRDSGKYDTITDLIRNGASIDEIFERFF